MSDPLLPIPETAEALRELTRYGDDDIARTLAALSAEARAVVPEIVGMSLSVVEGNLTFTVATTSLRVAEFDAMQYLDGGPCQRAAETGRVTTYRSSDPTDEDSWQLFAGATAAAGVASTLSFPVRRGDEVTAGINIYASTPDAFDDTLDRLAEVCGGWSEGAVRNADLGFASRYEAALTPGRLRAQDLIAQAVGVLMAHLHLAEDDARSTLSGTAHRSGLTDEQLARAIVKIFMKPSG